MLLSRTAAQLLVLAALVQGQSDIFQLVSSLDELQGSGDTAEKDEGSGVLDQGSGDTGVTDEGYSGDIPDTDTKQNKNALTFYSNGWDASRVQISSLDGEGSWTPFIDVDRPLGLGEFEDVFRARTHYKDDCRGLWCRNPVAMEVALSDKVLKKNPKAKIKDAFSCINQPDGNIVSRGFLCLNVYQLSHRFPSRDPRCVNELCASLDMGVNCTRCFNSKVRYFCQRKDIDCRHNTYPGLVP